MNWEQAMQAMNKGYKVRGTEWDINSWMSSSVIYVLDYEIHHFWSLTYEVLAEPEKEPQNAHLYNRSLWSRTI